MIFHFISFAEFRFHKHDSIFTFSKISSLSNSSINKEGFLYKVCIVSGFCHSLGAFFKVIFECNNHFLVILYTGISFEIFTLFIFPHSFLNKPRVISSFVHLSNQ
jgi:hypothetical protein